MKLNHIQAWRIKAMLLLTGSLLLQACQSGSSSVSSSASPSQDPVSELPPSAVVEASPSAVVEASPSAVVEASPSPAVPASPTCQELQPGFVRLSDPDFQGNTGGYYCFSVKDESSLQGVLTLRHTSGNGDWDIAVGRNLDPTSNQLTDLVSYQPSRGSINELVLLPVNNGNPYYVHVSPTATNQSSQACLVFHQFDYGPMFFKSLVTTSIEWAVEGIIVGDQPTAEAKANASRIVSLGSSVLQQRDIGQSSYDFLLNEVSLQLQNTFGADSWFFDFGMDFFGAYLEQSLKHLYTSDANCAG